MKRVMIGIRIDEDLKKKFQIWCLENNTSIQKELETYILKKIGEEKEEDK